MRTHKIAAWIIGGLIIAYCYAFVNAITTASENSYQCKALESAAITGHQIPLSVSQPNTPGAFCELGVYFPFLRTYLTVFIYGVLDRTQQDAILASLRAAPTPKKSSSNSSTRKTGALGPTPLLAAAAATAAPNTPSPSSGSPSWRAPIPECRAGLHPAP